MGVPTVRTDLASVIGSNSPSGADTVASGTGPDDYLRAHAAFIRQNYDDILTKAPIASPTFTGTVGGVTVAMVIGAAPLASPTFTGAVTIPSPFTLGGTSVTLTGAQMNALATATGGTYTPTLTDGANTSTRTALQCMWSRVGNVVTVAGTCAISATAAGETQWYATLPVTSSIAAYYELAGSGAASASGSVVSAVAIRGNPSGDKAYFETVSSGASGVGIVSFTFQYLVL